MNEREEMSGPAPLLAGLALAGARDVLKDEKEEGDDAQVALQRAIESALGDSGGLFEQDATDRELEGLDERDARAVAFLKALAKNPDDEITKHALDIARQWRDSAAERWALYTKQTNLPGVDDPKASWMSWAETARWQKMLAKAVAIVLWHGRVREEVEDARERDELAPPGLAVPVLSHLQQSFWAADTTLYPRSSEEGTKLELVASNGAVLASTATLLPEQVEILQQGTQIMKRYTAHLAVRGLVAEAHQRVRALAASPDRIGWEGGFDGMAEWLNLKSNKAPSELHTIVKIGQMFQHNWGNWREVGGLWLYDLQRAAPRRRAYLELKLGSMFMPYFSKNLAGRDRFVVPIVAMPPKVGREADWAPQSALQLSIVRAMVDRRVEFVRHGGALLPMSELQRLADAVGLPANTLSKVLDRWLQDGTDGPKCLERVDKDRYHLPDNPTYRAAREFLNGAGDRTIRRSKAGQAAARKRAGLKDKAASPSKKR